MQRLFSKFKRRYIILTTVTLFFALFWSEWGSYWWMQGKGQLNVLWNAEPMEEWVLKPHVTEKQRSKALLIEKIKQFAIDSLGISPSESYNKVFDQEGKPILWTLTACDPYALEPYKWTYPLIGEAGYRGYFNKERGQKDLQKMKEEGFDVSLDPVSAWSTLGWFDDPILSKMLDYSEGELARLIIHEMTHGTVFIESDAVFNENLATFIGDSGAYLFLIHQYGNGSEPHTYYSNRMQDLRLYKEHMHHFALELKDHYEIHQDAEQELKQHLKDSMITQFKKDLSQLSFRQPDRFKRIWADSNEINNTYFTGYLMYNNQQDSIRDLFLKEYGGDFEAWLQALKEEND
ncbi:aminopeptidase [bacterium SCSIO 12741]|nr:aminopeptidase [bacterium SCSIO 12741]